MYCYELRVILKISDHFLGSHFDERISIPCANMDPGSDESKAGPFRNKDANFIFRDIPYCTLCTVLYVQCTVYGTVHGSASERPQNTYRGREEMGRVYLPATLLVVVDRGKGGGRAPPTPTRLG